MLGAVVSLNLARIRNRATTWLARHRLNLRTAGVLCAWIAVVGAIVFFVYLIYLRMTLPAPESIATRQVKESTKIYDRTGEVLLYDIYKEEKRTIVAWDQVPQSVRDATVAAEDSNFYEHHGLDFKGIIRAFIRNLQSASVAQGGSTITQQLVKKALLGDQRTLSRKLREWMLAIEIERQFTKDQILWMYLNQIPYGSNAYGIESASRTFFAKPAAKLSLTEAATLAAMPNAPTYLSPYGHHVDELIARRNGILKRMRDLGMISQADEEAALKDQPQFAPPSSTFAAPHFVIMARDYLIKKYGEDIVESSGFKIITTLDAGLQTSAQELVAKYAEINKARYKAGNAALVAIDPRTGDVKALVGSANYFDTANEGNFNVATAHRQPGSSFKPFAYAMAFQKGYPDSTVLFDLKTEFNPNCAPDGSQKKDRFGLGCYHPQNYDTLYRGPVTLRQALSQSLNIPSVKTLYLAGEQETLGLAQKMGITTLTDPSRYGLSLVLGGAEVRLVDLVSAYGVFANDGIRNPWAFIQRIETADGTVLEERQQSPARVLDAQTTRLVTDVLSDNNARGPVFGYNSPLVIPGRDAAAKTGTTQDNRDAWVVGYTPSLVTGVWTGNNDNTPMTRTGAGISASGPLWHEFMARALAATPGESFIKPDPVSSSKIMLNGEYLPQDPSLGIHSILYYVDRSDPLGPAPARPDADVQFPNWEWTVQAAYPSAPAPAQL